MVRLEKMARKTGISPVTYLNETTRILGQCGLLLVSGKMAHANVMTIGWGLVGILWGNPFFMVAVRPSRYTYRFMEETDDFTVNVPGKDMEEVTDYCGTVSGRDHDKIKEKGLTLMPSEHVESPIIAECVVHYECKVVYKTQIVPKDLPKDIISTRYPCGDYHTLYFGEILAIYADDDAKEKLLAMVS